MTRPDLQRQIEDLQREVRELREREDERQQLSIRQQVWLAQTTGSKLSQGSEETDYPSATSSVFGVKFRRPKFTEQAGPQELEGPFGDDQPQRFALRVPQGYVAEGLDQIVVEINGRFYLIPDGRNTAIVSLDQKIRKAVTSSIEGSVSTPSRACIDPGQSNATIWLFDQAQQLCESEERIEWPEGVFNFQTDQEIPNTSLWLVHKEISGRWVPYCPVCAAPSPPTSVACICLSDPGLCQAFINFYFVDQVDPDERISGQRWPDYCNWVAPPDEGLVGVCGAGCILWNRIEGWEVEPESTTEASTNDCAYGLFQLGAARTPRGQFDTTGNYPCSGFGDITGLTAFFTCPATPDGTGTATVELWIKDCLIFILNFDEIIYTAEPSGLPPPSGTSGQNRVTRITIPNFDLTNPVDPFDRCHCLIETTRNDLFQGNFNAATGVPNLQNGGPGGLNVAGHNYTVNVAGTHDFGNGGVVLNINDVVVYDDNIWEWVVIPAKAGGAVDNSTFVPAEVVRFYDSDGCDWSKTLREAAIRVSFRACPP